MDNILGACSCCVRSLVLDTMLSWQENSKVLQSAGRNALSLSQKQTHADHSILTCSLLYCGLINCFVEGVSRVQANSFNQCS